MGERNDDVRQAAVVDQRVGGNARAAGRRDDAGAPVAEAVAVRAHRHRRIDHEVVATDQVRHAREVHVEVEDHRRGLRAVVDQFEAGANLHHRTPGVRRGSAPARGAGTACLWGDGVAMAGFEVTVVTRRSGGARAAQRRDERAPQRGPLSTAGEHDRLVDFQFDAHIRARGKAGPQVSREPVALARVRIVAAYTKLRGLSRERRLPARAERRLPVSAGVVQQADVGTPRLAIQHGREAVRRDMDHPIAARDGAPDMVSTASRCGRYQRATIWPRTAAGRRRVVAENDCRWPSERLRSINRRVVVDATSGASKARASARASASAPGSKPRWESSSARCPRNSRR